MTSIGAIFTASWMLFAQVPASDFASDMADGYLFPRGWAPQGGSPGEVRWLLSEDGEHGALQLNKTGRRTGSAWARQGSPACAQRYCVRCRLGPIGPVP